MPGGGADCALGELGAIGSEGGECATEVSANSGWLRGGVHTVEI